MTEREGETDDGGVKGAAGGGLPPPPSAIRMTDGAMCIEPVQWFDRLWGDWIESGRLMSFPLKRAPMFSSRTERLGKMFDRPAPDRPDTAYDAFPSTLAFRGDPHQG